MPRPTAIARGTPQALAGALATLLAGALPAIAADLTVEAPPGFAAHAVDPGDRETSVVEVTRPGDDAGCDVAFRAVKPSASRRQADLNAEAAQPAFLDSLRRQEGAKFDSADVGPFAAGAVQGGALVGVPAGSDGALKALLVILDTPEGRTLVSCSAAAAQFDGLLPAFQAVARGVKPPKG